MLIAIDHGNKQVKTVHGNAIVSGVQKSKTRPYGRDILKYGGNRSAGRLYLRADAH